MVRREDELCSERGGKGLLKIRKQSSLLVSTVAIVNAATLRTFHIGCINHGDGLRDGIHSIELGTAGKVGLIGGVTIFVKLEWSAKTYDGFVTRRNGDVISLLAFTCRKMAVRHAIACFHTLGLRQRPGDLGLINYTFFFIKVRCFRCGVGHREWNISTIFALTIFAGAGGLVERIGFGRCSIVALFEAFRVCLVLIQRSIAASGCAVVFAGLSRVFFLCRSTSCNVERPCRIVSPAVDAPKSWHMSGVSMLSEVSPQRSEGSEPPVQQ